MGCASSSLTPTSRAPETRRSSESKNTTYSPLSQAPVRPPSPGSLPTSLTLDPFGVARCNLLCAITGAVHRRPRSPGRCSPGTVHSRGLPEEPRLVVTGDHYTNLASLRATASVGSGATYVRRCSGVVLHIPDCSGTIVLYGFAPSWASSLTVDRRPCKGYLEHLIELSDEA